MVSLFTELDRLNPMRLVVPSSRENSLAVISVQSTDRGLSFPMKTEILNSMSTPNL